jgi:hypothetical protein
MPSINEELPGNDKLKIDRKWVKTLGLALSFPSTIFGAAASLFWAVGQGYISKLVAILVFLLVIGNILFLMVYYAFKNKG